MYPSLFIATEEEVNTAAITKMDTQST